MNQTTPYLFVANARNAPLIDHSIDTIITSPPYWQLRDYGVEGELGNESTPDAYIKSLLTVLNEWQRLLRPDGNVFIIIGDKYARTGGVDRKIRGNGKDPGGRRHSRQPQKGVPGIPDGSLIGLPYRLAIAAIDRGWYWRQDIVWAKPNPLPESVRRRCIRAHETILHLTRTAQHYVRPENNHGGACGHDVWSIPVSGYRDTKGCKTPAVYPSELVNRLLYHWCPPAGVVFDPFLGSGTTAISTIMMNLRHKRSMQFYGADIDPQMIEVTQRRCNSMPEVVIAAG